MQIVQRGPKCESCTEFKYEACNRKSIMGFPCCQKNLGTLSKLVKNNTGNCLMKKNTPKCLIQDSVVYRP